MNRRLSQRSKLLMNLRGIRSLFDLYAYHLEWKCSYSSHFKYHTLKIVR